MMYGVRRFGLVLPIASLVLSSYRRANTDRALLVRGARSLEYCFIGHEAFGIITKAAWVPYFAILGIPLRFRMEARTEAFRPLAGEPIWEFIERGGSYGAPLALAWLQKCARTVRCWTAPALPSKSS